MPSVSVYCISFSLKTIKRKLKFYRFVTLLTLGPLICYSVRTILPKRTPLIINKCLFKPYVGIVNIQRSYIEKVKLKKYFISICYWNSCSTYICTRLTFETWEWTIVHNSCKMICRYVSLGLLQDRFAAFFP